MEALRKKWKSSRGASILMAMLFLLVCMMVGASVLMAAVSNAGKLKSNREEQQKYLTLSSALTLVCDELNGAAYCGQYSYQRVHIDEERNDDGTLKTPAYDHHIFTRKPGVFTYKEGGAFAEKSELLPLLNDLDGFFSGKFNVDNVPAKISRDTYDFTNPNVSEQRSPHTLTLTVEGEESDWLNKMVTVTVTWNQDSGRIDLRAELEDNGHTYVMKAELDASNAPEKVLFPCKQSGNDVPEAKTDPITWTLVRILKE